MRNKYYELFTEKEIPHQFTRVATNCFNANLVVCNSKMAEKCRDISPELYEYCPRQTKSQLNVRKEVKN